VPFAPIPESALISRAAVAPIAVFTGVPFARQAFRIWSLRWHALPRNGERLRSLRKPPRSDAAGVEYQLLNGRRYYSPSRMGLQGLRFLDGYVRTGRPLYLARSVSRANKLLQLGIWRAGAIYFRYLRTWPGEGLRNPWYSAFGQGHALSLFVRLYRVTGEQRYLDVARAVFLSFRQLGPRPGPWVAYVLRGYLWLEEYPSRRPTHVLNGHIHALMGIYEFERLTGDPVARQMLEGALTTLRHHAHRYRVPGGLSYYDLVHFSRMSHYHALHILQLRMVAWLTARNRYFAGLANLLARDARAHL
jgi:D-glucuronyl C5-epimerase-like protein